MTEKPKKPFYKQIWFFALIGIITTRFLIPDSEDKKFSAQMDEATEAYKNENFDVALSAVTAALEIKPGNDSAEKLRDKTTEDLKQIQLAEKNTEKEKAQKEEAELKEQLALKESQMESADVTAEKPNDPKEKINKTVSQLLDMGEGLIRDIKPASGDDWIAVFAYIDDSWYLLSEEEKKRAAETIGPGISSAIVETGITDYSDVHFVDENGTTVASPNFWGGGYKVKN